MIHPILTVILALVSCTSSTESWELAFEQAYELIRAVGLDKQEIWTKVIIEVQLGSGIYLVTYRWVSNNIGAGVTV